MAGGGPAHTTQTSTTNPPQFAVGGWEQYLGALEQQLMPGGTFSGTTDLHGSAPLTYNPPPGGSLAPSPIPNQQVAPFAPSQTEALNYINQQGPYSPLAGAAQGQAQSTLQGNYLGPNPYLNEYYNQAAQNLVNNYQFATSPDITAATVQAGGLGGSGHAQEQDFARQELGTNLGNLAANIYEPAYQFERGMQATSAAQTPGLVSAGYIPSQAMMGAGGLEQTQVQNILNTAAQNLQQQGMWPYQALSMLGQGLGSLQGGSQVTISPNASQGIK